MNLPYIDMSTRHLRTRVEIYLNLDDFHKSAIKDRLRSCHQFCNGVYNVTSFKILNYDAKIHESLLIKN